MAETLLGIALAGGVIVLLFCGWMAIRHEKVGSFRRRLVDFVFDDPGHHEMKLEWYHQLPSYQTMANHPWRPLNKYLTGAYANDFRAWEKRQG